MIWVAVVGTRVEVLNTKASSQVRSVFSKVMV